jgi:hypothetical protein
LAIVLAGDTLTRAVYEWYETAGLLSPSCYSAEPLPEDVGFVRGFVRGFVPGEAVAALVLEPAGRREMRSYAHFKTGRWAAGGRAVESIGQMLGGSVPNLTICTGNGAPCATSSPAALAREISGPGAVIVPAQAVAAGLADAGALLHLILALSSRPGSGPALLVGSSGSATSSSSRSGSGTSTLGSSGDGGFAALLLEIA